MAWLVAGWGCAWGQTQVIYSCVDASGRKITADRPIAECADREQRQLGPSGTVRRVIGPNLSEHERAAQDAQRRKEAEERGRIQEERRRERALMARYPDKVAHDAERVEALQQIEDVIATALKRTTELTQQRKALDVEMEFYKNEPSKAPMLLRRQIAENEGSVQEQQRFIAGQEQEKRRIHQRFDAELARLNKLWGARPMVMAPPPGAFGAAR